MNDFCIRLENLPDFDYYNGDENVLKMKLWCHIHEIIKMQVLEDQKDTEEDQSFDFDDLKYRIADITFGKDNVEEAEILVQLNKIKEQIFLLEIKEKKDQN